jgi:putative flippase GtrA
MIKYSTSVIMASLLRMSALRFLIVGIVSSASYAGTMKLAVDGLGESVVIGAFAAFAVGTLISYLGNTFWTFSAPMSGRTFSRFVVVVMLGLMLNLFIAVMLNYFEVHYLLITLVILVVVPVFNYICHALWTYADHAAMDAK